MKITINVPDNLLKKISEEVSFLKGEEISEEETAREFAQLLIDKNFTQENLDCESIIERLNQKKEKERKDHHKL